MVQGTAVHIVNQVYFRDLGQRNRATKWSSAVTGDGKTIGVRWGKSSPC